MWSGFDPKGTGMAIGNVKWFNNAKGWGFIEREDGADVFVHYSQIRGEGFRTLNEGEPVQFTLKDGPKGPLAEDVRRLSDESESASSGEEEGSAEEGEPTRMPRRRLAPVAAVAGVPS